MPYPQHLKTLLVTAILLLASHTVEAAGQSLLMPGYSDVEAGVVELIIKHKTGKGVAVAHKCDICPLEFKVDKHTAFIVHGKQVSLSEALKHSLQMGTVQYKIDTMHAIQITW